MSAVNRRPGDRVVRVRRPVAGQAGSARRVEKRWSLERLFIHPGNDEESRQSRLLKYLPILVVLAVITWALVPVRETIGLLNIGLIYLIVVIGATLWAGQWAGMVTSVLGFALFDFFLVPPYLTFVIGDLHNILALFVFLGEATLISWLLSGARRQARQAADRADDVSRLYELSQVIIRAQSMEDVLPAIAKKVADLLGAGVCWILVPNERQQLLTRAQYPPDARQPSRDEMALASWVLWNGKDAGLIGQSDTSKSTGSARSTSPFEGVSRAPGLFAPLRVGERTIGVLAVADKRDGQPFTLVERTILNTLADQAAVALERLRLLREAERAEILARTDELKSALVSAVSHDLRTPVASMMALVTGLLDPEAQWDSETQREFHQIIYDELVRLNRLVGNLLDMSRIEGGALRPEKAWYSIGEVIQSVTNRLAAKLADHPLSQEVEDDMPLALFDFTEIDQVLTNLIENAIKYTPKGTSISVRASHRIDGTGDNGSDSSGDHKGDSIEVVVEDSGAGVAPEHLPHLFDKFYRVDRHADRGGTGGVGLGLSITKGLVEAHGGHIQAVNRPEGGLLVIFTIPVKGSRQPAMSGTSTPGAGPVPTSASTSAPPSVPASASAPASPTVA